MSNYRNFKFPFGGTGYVDPSNPTPDLQSILAYQNSLPVSKNTGGVQLVNDPKQYLQEYTERVRPELERKVAEVNKQYSNVPKGGTIVRNHDKLYDYYKSGDRLYYRKKGGKNWINISDNDVAQKRINDTIARNQKSYGGNKNAVKKEEAPVTTKTTKATSVANTTPTKAKDNSTRGSYPYSMDNITNIVRNAIYGNRPQFTPSKAKPAPANSKPAQPQGRRLKEPKSRPYRYIGGKKYYVYTDGKGNWIE